MVSEIMTQGLAVTETETDTDTDTDTDMDSKIAALRVEFVNGLPARLDTISSLMALLNDQSEHRHELYRQVHSLTGSLGLFEYAEASKTARSMCNLVEPDIPLDDVLYSQDELNRLLAELYRQVEELVRSGQKKAL